jgi:hypothetical protein
MNRRSLPALFVSLLAAFLLSACSREEKSTPADAATTDLIKPVKEKFCPDRRVAVFDIAVEKRGNDILLRGEVDNAAAKDELIAAVKSKSSGVILDSVLVLPDPKLGDKTYGIIPLSVGNMRSKPGNAEELGSQVLMGMVVKVLKKQRGYYYVQSHDKYLGWIDGAEIHLVTQGEADTWSVAPKVIATALYATVREQPSTRSLPVSDLVAACMMKRIGERGQWISVELPDGRKGFVERSAVQDYQTWKQTRRLTGANIVRDAKALLGIPYLWGGTSTKGMDCSGYTKTVYRLNGLELNRDANQQATMGTPVPYTDDMQNFSTGDLLFFGQKAAAEKPERITHVGIYLEKKQFIHSSGRVQLGSFDPDSPYYEGRLLERFVRARRVIPQMEVPEVIKGRNN